MAQQMAHVAAVRLYTTGAYKVLNSPMRDKERTAPHPLPVTISFLTAAIGKLRALGVDATGARKLDLWRGMREVTVPPSFMQHGGTELAPMSTSTRLEVAVQYSAASTSLLFKLRTDSFMQRGASMEWLSCFPTEEEMLYPPLTFLKPTGKKAVVPYKGRTLTVVEVTPIFGG